MRAICITVDLMFRSIKVKIHIINISNCTLYIVKFSLDLISRFWTTFVDSQNEATGLCVNNSINKT